MVVYPSEPGGALIEFSINGKECYFESIVNKSDALESYINILLKKLGIDNEVAIKVNGKFSTSDNQLDKKSIKKLIASAKSDRIFVEILTNPINKQV